MPIEEKPSRNEDEYFIKADAELLKAQRARLDEERAKSEKEQRQQTHFMKCPKCGHDLREEAHGPVKIDRCGTCKGVWLDAGELEMLDRGAGGGMFGGLFGRGK